MSDTHEEQLLSDLLNGIAREDAGLDAGHLEAGVIDACDAGATVRLTETVRLKADTTYWYLAIAAAVIAAMVPGIAWMMRDVATPTVNRNVAATAAPTNVTNSTNPTNPTTPTNSTTPARPTRPTRPSRPTPPTRPSPAEEFVPLMPMTEQELAGPFQLVRVQMPRASLGVLRSPLDHPNELVEADVLLGEDGMARAIRVSTGASVYPWRSR